MVQLRGWLGGFVLYFALQTVLLFYGTFYNQALEVFSGAILLGGFGLILAIAMGRTSRMDKRAMFTESHSRTDKTVQSQ